MASKFPASHGSKTSASKQVFACRNICNRGGGIVTEASNKLLQCLGHLGRVCTGWNVRKLGEARPACESDSPRPSRSRNQNAISERPLENLWPRSKTRSAQYKGSCPSLPNVLIPTTYLTLHALACAACIAALLLSAQPPSPRPGTLSCLCSKRFVVLVSVVCLQFNPSKKLHESHFMRRPCLSAVLAAVPSTPPPVARVWGTAFCTCLLPTLLATLFVLMSVV